MIADFLQHTPKRTRLLWILTILAMLSFGVSLYLALFYAGTDPVMGNVQRIFYMHVAAFIGASIGFFVTVVAGVMYLRTAHQKWDMLALAGVEVGVMLALINLVTGSVIARPIINTWWTWDPRLTSALIMVLTYLAYLMFRNGISSPELARRFSAVYGIFAFTTVIFTVLITRVRSDTVHINIFDFRPTEAITMFDVVPNMPFVFFVTVGLWCICITPTLIWWRVRLENLSLMIRYRHAQLLDEA